MSAGSYAHCSFCPRCWMAAQMCWRQCSLEKAQNGERCQDCSVCQLSILWLDHINKNVALQLVLFDRLVHIIRHLYNSASWGYVESVPPVGMHWCPFDDCQLLLEVQLKEICFAVSVCYIKENPSWDAVLCSNRTSIFHICCIFYFLYIYPCSCG